MPQGFSPQDFMSPVPSLRVDTAPMLKIADLLSQAPGQAAKGFETGSDIALRYALSDPSKYTDSSGNIDWNKLVKLGAQQGGLPFVEKLAPYVYMSGSNRPPTKSNTQKLLDPDADKSEAQTETPPPAPGANPQGQAGNVAAITGQSSTGFKGSGTEDDPFLLPDERALKLFQAQQNFPNGSHWILTNSGWKGIKGQPSATRLGEGPTPSIKGPIAKSPPTPEDQAPAGQTTSASPPQAGGVVSGASAPVAPPPSPEMAAARKQLAEGLRAGEGFALSQQQPAGQPQVAQTSTAPAPVPQRAPQPVPQAVPQFERPPPRTVRPPLKQIDPVTNNPEIRKNEQEINRLLAQAAAERQEPQFLGRTSGAADLEAKANILKEKNTTLAAELRKPYEKINEAHANGFDNVAAWENFKETESEKRKAGLARAKGIQGAETIYSQDMAPYAGALHDALNNPNGPWTGIGAHTALDWNRAKAALGGDQRAAAAQEAFEKNISNLRLGLFNLQKALGVETGSTAGRMFQLQAVQVKKATGDLGNTLAGNRYVVEMSRRVGEQYRHIAAMARAYQSDPQGPGYPDDEFSNRVAKYLQTPREQGGGYPFTKQEQEHQELIGAPQAPVGLRGDALKHWQLGVGLQKGDPYRREDGSYGGALTGK